MSVHTAESSISRSLGNMSPPALRILCELLRDVGVTAIPAPWADFVVIPPTDIPSFPSTLRTLPLAYEKYMYIFFIERV